MGREIVYCPRCQARLTGADLEQGRAVRIDGTICCSDCLVPSEMAALAKPRAGRAAQDVPSTTRRTASAPRRTGLLIAGGAGTLLLAALLTFLAGRSASPPREPLVDVTPPPKVPPPSPPPAPMSTEIDALRAELAGTLSAFNFAAGQSILERARGRRADAAWATAVAAFERDLAERARARFDHLAQAAPDDLPRAREEIARWGPAFRSLLDDFDRSHPAAPAPPPPPPAAPTVSPALRLYREAWEKAMLLAARRDFDRARAELESAGAGLREDEHRNENAEDLADVALLRSLAPELLKAAAELPRGEAVEFDAIQEDGTRTAVRSRIIAAGPRRLVLSGEPRFVELEDIAPGSLARLLARGEPAPERRRALALVHALDGNWLEALRGGERLPAKYEACAATALERLPKPDPVAQKNEWNARRLFYEAQRELPRMETRAEAVGKCRRLLEDYADTALVRKSRDEIGEGADQGRDYAFVAADLRGRGVFRSRKFALEFRKTKVDAVVWFARENPPETSPDQRVEAAFAALPGVKYRAWALVGGCCATTFTWLLQADGLVYRDRKTGKDLACGPDDPRAAPWEHRLSGLSSSHGGRDHAKAEKEPKRWDWAELPVPAYASGGLKTIRLIGTSKGMSVAAVVVSAGRDKPPDDVETRKLAEASMKEGEPFSGFRFGKGEPDLLEQLPEARSMELVYDLDLAKLKRPPAYDVDRRAEIKGRFDRVAYLLELQPAGGAPQAVFVSMDAFTDDIGRIGIPDADYRIQQKAASMNVYSNVPAIVTGTELGGGNLEFWPNNYGGGNSAGVPGADGSVYDFGDQPGNPVMGYGCMQVHNTEAKQTIFAINHWAEGARADLGIGNSDGATRDWTFKGNAASYASKRLRILVRPAR